MEARSNNHTTRRARIERAAVGVLSALLAWGLWEGYGAWIVRMAFEGALAHAP